MKKTFLLFLFMSALLALAGADRPQAKPREPDVPKKLLVSPPPFTPGIFPCSQCHAGMPVDRRHRKLQGMHEDIALNHMPGGWCFDCHNPNNRDTLRLANGRTVRFEESYNLCGQCHGTILRVEGRTAREAHGHVERREAVPALRPLPLAP